MRTSIELPDPLFREIKTRAAIEGKSLKETFLQIVLAGIGTSRTYPTLPEKPRFPTISGADGTALSNLDSRKIAALEEEEDLERIRRSL